MGNCFGKIMSQVIYMSEKLSMWCSICSMVTCIILSLVCMLCFGIGIGYNYSYVDYRTKHIYVAGKYKKVRPTSYYGPGFFKPTQKDTRRLVPKLVHRVSEQTTMIEVRSESPEDLPTENMMELVKAELALPERRPELGPSLTDIYFKDVKTVPTAKLRYVRKFNRFNVTSSLSIKSQTEANDDIANKSSNNHTSTTEEYSGPEAIRVDIAKVTNLDNSSISNTIMSLKRLLGFLKIMREKKKRFSVQVIPL